MSNVGGELARMTKRKKSTGSMPDLTIEEVLRECWDANGKFVSRYEWAVVSDEGQEPLTEAQATEILAAYMAIRVLLASTEAAKPLRKRR